MRRLQSMVWMLSSVMAASAALVVTFAHAALQHLATGADRWSAEEMTVLASLSLKRLPPVPVDLSNAVERLRGAIDLGQRLVNDARFSSNGAVSCASCHDPQKQFQGGLPVSGPEPWNGQALSARRRADARVEFDLLFQRRDQLTWACASEGGESDLHRRSEAEHWLLGTVAKA